MSWNRIKKSRYFKQSFNSNSINSFLIILSVLYILVLVLSLFKKLSNKIIPLFPLFTGILFPLIIGYLIPLFTGHNFRIWTLFFAFPLILIAIISPTKLSNFYKFWIRLGNIIGFINSRIILGTIFFLILMPTAFLMKIFGYDPLRIKKTTKNTYRELRKNANINIEKIF